MDSALSREKREQRKKEKFFQALTDLKAETQKYRTRKLCPRSEISFFEWESELAQIVIGVRRSGKSTLCHQALIQNEKKYAYINFDDEQLGKLKDDDLNTLLEIAYQVYGDFDYLFLDEVQNIVSWYLFVNRLLRQGIHLIITGSNAKLLSRELATHLTGRYNAIELFPFSFSEYCSFNYGSVAEDDFSTRGTGLLNGAFQKYMDEGGFPELHSIRNKKNYVQNLFDDIIRRDIQNRYKIRNPQSLESIAAYLADNFCQETVNKTLATLFNLSSIHTAEKYVGYLQEAYIFLPLHKYSFKPKERIRNTKNYLVDVGFFTMRQETLSTENIGWRLENIVYIELLRRAQQNGHQIFYFKKNYEIDFVVKRGSKIIELVQVCVELSKAKTARREFNALLKGAKELNCQKLTVVTQYDDGTMETDDGIKIKIVSAVRWLTKR